jgi:hypothetical protein
VILKIMKSLDIQRPWPDHLRIHSRCFAALITSDSITMEIAAQYPAQLANTGNAPMVKGATPRRTASKSLRLKRLLRHLTFLKWTFQQLILEIRATGFAPLYGTLLITPDHVVTPAQIQATRLVQVAKSVSRINRDVKIKV